MTALSSSFFRFLLVGASFSIGYSACVAFLVGPMGLPPFWSSTLLFALCIPLAFTAHRLFSFKGRRVRRRGVLPYAFLQIVSFATVSAAMSRFVVGDYWRDAALYFATVGTAAVLTFLVSRFFVFIPSDAKPPRSADCARKPR